MTHVTCGLTAKIRDQLRNPTLCIRVSATFTFLTDMAWRRLWLADFFHALLLSLTRTRVFFWSDLQDFCSNYGSAQCSSAARLISGSLTPVLLLRDTFVGFIFFSVVKCSWSFF